MEQLKELRESLQLTQTEFGLKIGVCRSSIAKIECGEMKISSKIAAKISEVFNVPFSAIEGLAVTDARQMHNLELLEEMEGWTGDFRIYGDTINDLFYQYLGDNIEGGDVMLISGDIFYLKKAVDFFKKLQTKQ